MNKRLLCLSHYLEVMIPFEGFYGTQWEAAIDNEVAQTAEFDTMALDGRERGMDEKELQHLNNSIKIGQVKYGQILWDNYKFVDCRDALAKEYAKSFFASLKDVAGIEMIVLHTLDGYDPQAPALPPYGHLLQFVNMHVVCESPREYNFANDRIFVKIHIDSLAELYKRIPYDVLAAVVKDEFSPRSGFSPFSQYHNGDLTMWPGVDPTKVMREVPDFRAWDHNQLACLLGALNRCATKTGTNRLHEEFVEAVDGDDSILKEVMDEIVHDLHSNGDISNAVHEGIDWKRVEEQVAEAAAENSDA